MIILLISVIAIAILQNAYNIPFSIRAIGIVIALWLFAGGLASIIGIPFIGAFILGFLIYFFVYPT